MMIEANVTFHNKIELKIQAQIFSEYTLISTGIAASGETCTLSNDAERYDVYFRDLATGRVIARKFDNDAKTIILRKERGLYVIDSR